MKFSLLYLYLFILFTSCLPSEKEANDYFQHLNNQISAVRDNPVEIQKIYDREYAKYKQHGSNQYLIGTKYVELSLRRNEEDVLVYELLKLNNDKYDYISISCNYNLALQFEFTSPELAEEFLNKAIELDQKTGQKYFLPHLFHLKGRMYYSKKDYKKALFYFNECLKNVNPKEQIFVSSMHNNFGLCYNKMNDTHRAIEETRIAIKILEDIPKRDKQEELFLNFIKGNLGGYFLKLKDYNTAEKILSKELEFYIENNYSHESINPSIELAKIYSITNQTQKLESLIEAFKKREAKLNSVSERIDINKIIQKYYADTNDLRNLKVYSDKITTLNDENSEITAQNLTEKTNLLNNYIIKNVNQKYDYQKRKNLLLTIIISLTIITFLVLLTNIRNRNKREREKNEKQKIILENKKEILEKDIKIQDEKIKNLYHSLNLKIETEKAFLDSLRKIKKQKNTDPEEVLKDLLLKVNNLIHVDKRNFDLINECSAQNKEFLDRLSDRFPILTNMELKLCVYFRLNLSSKEISSFENTTPNTIRVYKTKIKTKLGLDRETSLDIYLKNI
ncbi:tetratricopeptide repeat protein [Chryseobacterium daeguense]|uniref:tetratricopeptide repeat protein n=1 Tax=Chryseobacterium daeguense TaxID=412438 RepID=UPI000425E016|nr:response regulator transcription factor [Chryseobacterium daeguense]